MRPHSLPTARVRTPVRDGIEAKACTTDDRLGHSSRASALRLATKAGQFRYELAEVYIPSARPHTARAIAANSSPPTSAAIAVDARSVPRRAIAG